jgi:Arc-like DNA binding dprotein
VVPLRPNVKRYFFIVKLFDPCYYIRALESDMARKPQELRPVMTRIPEALRRRLERAAERNNRSMNTEIIHRLEESFAIEAAEAAGAAAAAQDAKLDKIVALLLAQQSKDDGEKK